MQSPRQAIDPQRLLHFIELRGFTPAWDKVLKLTDEDDLLALQQTIMANPAGASVIAGTGGLRKLRFAPPNWDTGKRGAVRVCYVHFATWGIVVLVAAYSKSQKDDLSAKEKKELHKAIERIETALELGRVKPRSGEKT